MEQFHNYIGIIFKNFSLVGQVVVSTTVDAN